ncbi:MAG: hypothetical protein LBS74_10805 [Oscillospiraceae bacterium]|jgi:hypothetical protein|nr:hypothetical protein [Oscillospiraceae bacterium]
MKDLKKNSRIFYRENKKTLIKMFAVYMAATLLALLLKYGLYYLEMSLRGQALVPQEMYASHPLRLSFELSGIISSIISSLFYCTLISFCLSGGKEFKLNKKLVINILIFTVISQVFFKAMSLIADKLQSTATALNNNALRWLNLMVLAIPLVIEFGLFFVNQLLVINSNENIFKIILKSFTLAKDNFIELIKFEISFLPWFILGLIPAGLYAAIAVMNKPDNLILIILLNIAFIIVLPCLWGFYYYPYYNVCKANFIKNILKNYTPSIKK